MKKYLNLGFVVANSRLALAGKRRSRESAVRAQRGIGALEWIAIIAVILYILYQALGRIGLMNAGNSNLAETSAVSSLYTSIRSNLKSSTGYGVTGTNLITTLNQVNGIPSNLSYSAGTLLNTFGVAYTIVSSNAGFGFTITDPGLSDADCAKLAVQQSQSGNWTGGITINGTAEGTAGIPSATATAACAAAPNTVIFASLT
ncbi:hypothetical protein R70006_04970 [Paraburkholderia domus]|uniref:type 4 pilus major pilin n=1 Tax=Paraburkholderia domus TaxID=2793075 RepID=UPI001912D1E0|nr:type 4 pilus major pilin [Paraburkholderia domus]MBK5051794.1 type IV B pilus protein [Burkholderia sp. R-70006]CAE6793718.1 hypothetical protein R70006_04970 [Paraburkholderia domus]